VSDSESNVDVLVVGGGPVGLTLAIELGQLDIVVQLVDQRPAPGILPKMERCNARTMENFRRLGLAEKIRTAGLDQDVPMDVFVCVQDITRKPLVHHAYPSARGMKAAYRETFDGSVPAEPYQLISQYTLEPLLRTEAEATPEVTVSFGQRMTNFVSDDGGVTATLQALDGSSSQVRAKYLVGCDGASSTVREILGIQLQGESRLELRQALFRSDELFDRIPIGRGRHYHIADDRNSFLIVQDDKRHFSLHASVESDDEMPKLFERIVGFPIEYETLYVGKWVQRLMVAEQYGRGRVFLAGDSAHLVIPTGGLGMNTGHGDAVDLAWKLAGTLQGWGGPELLGSYEAERRPIGLRNVEASKRAANGRRTWRSKWVPEITEDSERGLRARAELADVADREQRWSNDLYGIELGYRYIDSPVIWPFEGEAPDPNSFEYQPTTAHGARLPNIWLRNGSPLQDQLGKEYTLLDVRGAREGHEFESLQSAFEKVGAPFRVVKVDSPSAAPVYGADLILVRPDLHIVWRGDSLAKIDPNALVSRATGWLLPEPVTRPLGGKEPRQ
jgi:2-polyprenyl-6-methoxyphenol hydroxylase-like FAD-dependent oxidoreductase